MASFPSIRIEGGLLGPELLDQVIAADVPGQKPADFGLEPKRNLTDEIAAAFADSRALWGVFQNRLAKLTPEDLATSVTRDNWGVPFRLFPIFHLPSPIFGTRPPCPHRRRPTGTRPGPAERTPAPRSPLAGSGIPQPHRARLG